MRHRVAFRKLNRTSSHRLAMLGNMVASLLEHEAIRTTLPKAKEARRVAERIITLGKRGGLSNVRLASRTIPNKSLLQKVFGNLRDRYADRPGGYTRIVRLGYRPGDSAEVALLELVDRPAPEAKTEEKPQAQREARSAPEEKKAKAEVPEAEQKPGKKAKETKKAKKEPTFKAEEKKPKASKSRASKEEGQAASKKPEGKKKKSEKSK
jgi:large subunit ribosomal protein L17